MRASSCWLVLCVAAACGGGPPASGDPAAIQQFGGKTMGSTYEVKFVGAHSLAAVKTVVEDELAAFDATFSNWRTDSEIARVNAHASSEPLPVSPRFAAVLQLALDVAVATEGAFDPTVKPLCDVFRRAKADPQHRLSPDDLAAAKQRVGHGFVRVVGGAIVKVRPDVQLDLDGLVAGAACDAIAVRLDALGVRAFYLEVTGEVLCRGEKAPGQPWVIGVVDPEADAAGSETPVRTLSLRDAALCTSGDYRNAFVADGAFVHHIFDPRTGRSADAGVVSVSVLAKSAAVADALGTAFLVLGENDTKRLWPGMQRMGATGVLFLLGTSGTLRQVEIAWPKQGP